MSLQRITYKDSDTQFPVKTIKYPSFDSYDDFSAKDFNDFVYDEKHDTGEFNYDMFKFKKDYINENESKFRLTHPQMFVPKYANFRNNFQGLLVYHGLGSGKTCTSILVGEAYRAFRDHEQYIDRQVTGVDNRIIVVLRASLEQQFKNELLAKLDESGCLSRIQYKGNNITYIPKGTVTTSNRLSSKLSSVFKPDAIINMYWDITTHNKFVNNLFDDDDKLNRLASKLKQGQKLVIIDEIQNLISETGKMYSKLINAAKMFSYKNKFVVLSATPIYDKPFEIGLVMNLVNPRLYFPDMMKDFNKLFFLEAEKINKKLFYWMCSGYVSYFSGGNPKNFPFKRVIEVHHTMSDFQQTVYLSRLINDIKPSFSQTIKQENEIDPETISDLDEKTSSSYLSGARQLCNIVYDIDLADRSKDKSKDSSKDSSTDKSKSQLDDMKIKDLKRVLETITNKSADEEDTPQELNVKFSTISKYSTKMSYIARMIFNSNHKSFVFSDLLCYGVSAMGAILESLGFVRLTEKYAVYKGSNTKYRDDFISKHRGKVFTIWDGSIKNKNEFSKSVLELYNDPRNIDGSMLKVVMGTDTIKEGISLLEVRDVHIINPWWNESHFDQVVARAIRLNSHSKLPEKDRYVNIYKHLSVYHEFPQPINIKSLISNREKSEQDKIQNSMALQGFLRVTVDQHINNRSMAKKGNAREFEVVLKASSVDCKLNRYGNLIRLTEHIVPHYTPFNSLVNNESRPGGYRWYNNRHMIYYENNTNGLKYAKKSNVITNLEDYVKSIPDLVEKDVLYPLKKDFPVVSGDYQVRSFFRYEFDSSNTNNLTFSSANPLYKITKDLIINENINCDEDSDYRIKDAQGLISATKNYKLTKYNKMVVRPVEELVDCIYDTKFNTAVLKKKLISLIMEKTKIKATIKSDEKEILLSEYMSKALKYSDEIIKGVKDNELPKIYESDDEGKTLFENAKAAYTSLIGIDIDLLRDSFARMTQKKK